jgi:hypothetical protein
MKISLPVLVSIVVAGALAAAEKLTIAVTHELAMPRPAEMITVPWPDVARLLPGAEPDKVIVRDAAGRQLATQFTNLHPDDPTGRYDDLLFQHDFAAGEQSATFTLEKSAAPVPPFPSQVSARWVPERYDDFAFENDRIAHRIYGPGLETEVAGRTRMIGSGIDVWAKRVAYPVVDRWYLRGHDNYHKDNGEGLDFYSVGTTRGAGGTGVWDGQRLRVSHNWRTCRVIANGPIRAVFELTYGAWDAGNGATIAEVKRFTVDAGQNLHRVESTYSVFGAGSVTVALGLGKMKSAGKEVPALVASHPAAGWLGRWTIYAKPDAGELGTGMVLGAGAFAGTAEDDLNQLALVPVKPGQTLAYYVGAGWSRSGQFADAAAWSDYLAAFAARVRAPLKVSITAP